jgi:hypothetical protein
MAQLLELPEALLAYIKSYPGLPVKPGQVALDGLAPTGPAVSIQINPGQIAQKYVDGTEIWKQPFTIYYRSSSTTKNEDKAAMIGFLNEVGKWMKNNKPSILGGQILSAIAQVGTANINNQDNSLISYSATYMFEYQTEEE